MKVEQICGTPVSVRLSDVYCRLRKTISDADNSTEAGEARGGEDRVPYVSEDVSFIETLRSMHPEWRR